MTKTMKIERETIMKAARETYDGDLEKYLSTISKQRLTNFRKKVQERFFENLEREHPGKNFVMGKQSLFKANLNKKVGSVLKGKGFSLRVLWYK